MEQGLWSKGERGWGDGEGGGSRCPCQKHNPAPEPQNQPTGSRRWCANGMRAEAHMKQTQRKRMRRLDSSRHVTWLHMSMPPPRHNPLPPRRLTWLTADSCRRSKVSGAPAAAPLPPPPASGARPLALPLLLLLPVAVASGKSPGCAAATAAARPSSRRWAASGVGASRAAGRWVGAGNPRPCTRHNTTQHKAER